MVKKKHIAGIGVSAAIFGVTGMFLMYWASIFGGVKPNEPLSDFATGVTHLPIAGILDPFGLTPAVIGLSSDATILLPAFPETIVAGNTVIHLSDLTVGQFFGFGGAAVGVLVGIYYVIRISYEQRQDEAQPDSTNGAAADE